MFYGIVIILAYSLGFVVGSSLKMRPTIIETPEQNKIVIKQFNKHTALSIDEEAIVPDEDVEVM